MVKVSIIIPVKEINNYILNFIPIILKQDFQDFEIIILPDSNSEIKFEKTRIIPTGHIGPAEKRDIGVKKSKGEIIAFIDDDAYPENNWLKNAIKIFEDEDVAIVGGPNLTPRESNIFQIVSGEALSSWLVSGPVYYRYIKAPKRETDDLPSCNLIVRKRIFNEVGGFDTSFWPGEDTKFCLDVKNKGYRIVYSPEVSVFHHRRKNLIGYLKQISSYGVHRGFFAKKYPKSSMKLSYFIPSLFTLGLILGPVLGYYFEIMKFLYIGCLIVYLAMTIFEAIKKSHMGNYTYFIWVVFLTHITYGLGFLNGLTKKDLRSKYR